MSKNLLIKSKSPNSLRIVESADSTPQSPKYIFSGVFTACSTPDHIIINRNKRSYPETEMLKHIHYLRENIKSNGFILGELDHPIDRFDTQLKEASHKITDLWYDQTTHNVMGKLEVLDTPNGQIARTLIDSGYPLFVSSRAAGEVDPKTHEVHIEQIFTYDIVCTPGFAEARLERVNESLNSNITKYLNESVATQKNDELSTKKYGVLLEGVSVCEMSCEAPVSETVKNTLAREVSVSEVSTPILEDEMFELPQAELNPELIENEEAPEEKKEDSKEVEEPAEKKEESEEKEEKSEEPKEEKILTDEEKTERRAMILKVEILEGNDEQTEEELEERRSEILSVEAVDDEEEITEPVEEEKKEDSEEKEEKSEEEPEKTDECGDKCPTDMKTKDVKTFNINDSKKAEDIKSKTESDMDKFKALLSKAKTKNEVKESICKKYPFAISLSDENFAKFAALQPGQKNKCMKFVVEHAIFDVQQINELWSTPLIEEKRQLKNWLRLASEEDKRLFTNASQEEQDAIEESAKYVLIRTAEDADLFWERTGLRQRAAMQYINEMNQDRYRIATKEEINESVETPMNAAAEQLGYSMNYFKFLEDTFNN